MSTKNHHDKIERSVGLLAILTIVAISFGTLVLITHRPALTARAHKLLILNQGQQQRFGPAGEVMAELQQLNASNQPELKRAAQTTGIPG